jgi:hypothetical protein
MTSKFEQLIEFVINDEEAKAKELFHDIVVEKSREIYENLMNEEELDEESDAERDDHAEKAGKKVAKDIEYDEMHEEEEMDDESMEESFGGDASDDLIKDVESKEKDDADAEFDDEAEEAGEEETKDIEADHDAEGDMEDRVVDLEDKLDELMAEFEALMGDEAGEEHGDFDMEADSDEVGGDAYATDDTADFSDVQVPMSENVSLAKVPAPTHGDNGANAKSPVAFNSGAAGMQGKPVKNSTTEANPDGTAAYKAPTSYADKGRGDLPGANNFKNVPGKDGSKLAPAPKPTTAQASGTNSRTPFPKG